MPVAEGYFADPFVLRLDDGTYIAYGSGPPVDDQPQSPRVFEAMSSPDLSVWTPLGGVLERLGAAHGDEYWAPEVARIDGAYWMYYSVGHGIAGHHLRVARAASPVGPFVDAGVNLTPQETFAIDAHPFRDDDGHWYLFFARDVVEAERPGTHLAVARMASPTALDDPPETVLEPNHDWQIYQRERAMYGRRFDWHTLEGPAVVRRGSRYWLTYSGGAWTGPGYAVSWAVADHPMGPWRHAPADAPSLLRTGDGGLIGPGHNSLTTAPDGRDVIAFHAWDEARTARRMHVLDVDFTYHGPRVHLQGGPASTDI
ncbi:glycoside hydrolase family 43 protein [Demequina aestuarii]|uniref:glycoside hydrolase family 43 protein n=1 Tax=Demequina aestuarii TaxID=327095 RepID=UPI0007839B8F|nr:glycoside hydrolase family 43 protein [Demequina aestuarii]